MEMLNRNKAQEGEIEELRQVLGQKEDDLKAARATCDLYLSDFQRVDKERVLAEGRATKAEEDANTLRATRAVEVGAAKDRGFDEGWNAAGVEYQKQVRDIEAELHRDRFMDGVRFGHEALLSKLSLPADSELRAMPEVPPEELVLPEEEEEQVQNTEAGVLPEGQVDPTVTATADEAAQTPLPPST
jgi:hypothetical protein